MNEQTREYILGKRKLLLDQMEAERLIKSIVDGPRLRQLAELERALNEAQ